MDADFLIDLVRKMPKLETIEPIATQVKFDANLFEAILEIIKNRSDSRPLQILLCKSNDSITVSDKLREANKNSLNLVMICP